MLTQSATERLYAATGGEVATAMNAAAGRLVGPSRPCGDRCRLTARCTCGESSLLPPPGGRARLSLSSLRLPLARQGGQVLPRVQSSLLEEAAGVPLQRGAGYRPSPAFPSRVNAEPSTTGPQTLWERRPLGLVTSKTSRQRSGERDARHASAWRGGAQRR